MSNTFSNYQIGFDVGWELDFWGRFRRGIETAEASLNASVADYDASLVILTADVAGVYVNIRTLEARLKLARDNIALQKASLRIAQIRFDNGATTELDVQQAKANLAETKALVPALYSQLRQSMNGLNLLLGNSPGELVLPASSGVADNAALVQERFHFAQIIYLPRRSPNRDRLRSLRGTACHDSNHHSKKYDVISHLLLSLLQGCAGRAF